MDEITSELVEQIAKVRALGETNMLDRPAVQFFASELGCFALVLWIEDNKKDYWRLLEKLSDHISSTNPQAKIAP